MIDNHVFPGTEHEYSCIRDDFMCSGITILYDRWDRSYDLGSSEFKWTEDGIQFCLFYYAHTIFSNPITYTIHCLS